MLNNGVFTPLRSFVDRCFRAGGVLLLLGAFCLLFSPLVMGEETLLEIELSTKDPSQARQKGIDEWSLQLMERFIEPAKLKAQKKRIQKIISTYSNRYILYTKTGSPVLKQEDPKIFVFPVTIGFSIDNLKKILLKEDLFYSGTSHLRVLPLVLWEDHRQNHTSGWWQTEKPLPSASRAMRVFYNHLQGVLMSQGFFAINPDFSALRLFVPSDLLFKQIDKDSAFRLSKMFQFHLVILGHFVVRESDMDSILNVQLKLSAYNVDNGRLLAEVSRFEKLKSPPASTTTGSPLPAHQVVEDFLAKNTGFAYSLGSQLKLLYEEGDLSSHLIKITVKGLFRSKDLERFKKELIRQIPATLSLKEHIIQSGSLTYIANTTIGVQAILEQVKSRVFTGFRVDSAHVKANELILKVSL